jgi:hypothetical protein
MRIFVVSQLLELDGSTDSTEAGAYDDYVELLPAHIVTVLGQWMQRRTCGAEDRLPDGCRGYDSWLGLVARPGRLNRG